MGTELCGLRRIPPALLAAAVLLGVCSGCGVSGDQIISATASIPTATLQAGELGQVYVGGVLRRNGVTMPLVDVRIEDGQPVAEVLLGYSGGPKDNGLYTLHLGESVTAQGSVITLVSLIRYPNLKPSLSCSVECEVGRKRRGRMAACIQKEWTTTILFVRVRLHMAAIRSPVIN